MFWLQIHAPMVDTALEYLFKVSLIAALVSKTGSSAFCPEIFVLFFLKRIAKNLIVIRGYKNLYLDFLLFPGNMKESKEK